MNVMIKGFLIAGGLALVSIAAQKCQGQGTITCPKVAYLDEPFKIISVNSKPFDGYKIMTSSGGEICLICLITFVRDTSIETYKYYSAHWRGDKWVEFSPGVKDTYYGYRPAPAPSCIVMIEQRPTAVKMRGNKLKAKVRTGLNVLGRDFHAPIR